MKNKLIVIALAVAAAAIPPGCGTGEASVADPARPESNRPLPVEVAMPRTLDIFATYETTAPLAADQEALVPARADGEVVEILVEEGEFVDAGEPLARLDGARLRLEMLQAKANFQMATREYERSLSLHERGLVSASSFETLEFELDALEAAYELKRLNFEYTTVRATISGMVVARHVKTGWQVQAGDPAFSIADTSRLVAELHIPQSEIGRFSAGLDAVITVDAMPGETFSATIARISPTIDSSDGSFRATVYVDNGFDKTEGLLAPGMFGRFSIACEKHADALVVPSDAVMNEDNEDVVYVIEDGAALRRLVTVGIRSKGVTEILDGLSANEPVVVTGQDSLRNGSKVFASNEFGVAG